MPAKRILLGDLGGTRLRLSERGVIDVKTFEPAKYPSLQAALTAYAPDLKGATLLLSFAKKVNADSVYHLDQAHKKGAWSFRIDDMKRDMGLKDMQVLHDMQAMGRAVFHPDAFTSIGGGAGNDGFKTIINVGTGLGHAFIDPVRGAVHDTFGGHFPPTAVTHEQREALRLIEKSFGDKRSFIWEEIVSGRGLEVLDEQTMDGTRLFCEFLGLYANTLAVSMDAFGGVYLCGGVIEHLFTQNQFDIKAFTTYFLLNNVPIVDDALRTCPLYRAYLPHTALYGLDIYAQSLSHN
ncbi:MAG TPA: glucokinase [Alphaproteobacteria bacterium]